MSPVSSGSQVINTEVEGDPTGCHASANQLSALAGLLQRISRDNTSASRAIVDAWKGTAASAFEGYAHDLDRNIDQLAGRLKLAREGLTTFAELLKQVMSGMAMLRAQAAAAGLRVNGFYIYAPVAGLRVSFASIARLAYQQAVFRRLQEQANKLRHVEDQAHEHLAMMLNRLDATKWSLRKRPGGPGRTGSHATHQAKRKVTPPVFSKRSKGGLRKWEDFKSTRMDSDVSGSSSGGNKWSAVAPYVPAAAGAAVAGGVAAAVAGVRTGAVAAKATTAAATVPVKAAAAAAESGARMPMMPMGMGGMGAGGAVGANGAVKGGLAAGRRGMLSGKVASSVLGKGDPKSRDPLAGGPAGAAKALVDDVKSGGAALPW